jgi:hypothetical protein
MALPLLLLSLPRVISEDGGGVTSRNSPDEEPYLHTFGV